MDNFCWTHRALWMTPARSVAVKRGLEHRKTELVSRIGVEEKAFRKGHNYPHVQVECFARPRMERARKPAPSRPFDAEQVLKEMEVIPELGRNSHAPIEPSSRRLQPSGR